MIQPPVLHKTHLELRINYNGGECTILFDQGPEDMHRCTITRDAPLILRFCRFFLPERRMGAASRAATVDSDRQDEQLCLGRLMHWGQNNAMYKVLSGAVTEYTVIKKDWY